MSKDVEYSVFFSHLRILGAEDRKLPVSNQAKAHKQTVLWLYVCAYMKYFFSVITKDKFKKSKLDFGSRFEETHAIMARKARQ